MSVGDVKGFRRRLNKHPEALQAADQLLEKYGEVK